MRHRPTDRCGALLGALLLACGLLLPCAVRAQEAGGLPDQLSVIAGVRFEGVRQLRVKDLRAANLKTRRPSRLPWATRPALRFDYLRADTATIVATYRHYGFLDAHASWRFEPTRDPEAVRVVFQVREGPRTRIADVTLEGVTEFHDRELRRALLARVGEPFDPAFLPLDTLRLSALYQERGRRPHTEPSAARRDSDSTQVSVRYRILEGPRYRIGRIDVESNGSLRESLARRELLLHTGDVYRRTRLEESVQRLYDTGLYSQVQVSTFPDTSEATLDLALRVAERRPRWVDLGIGSGTAELFRFTGEWGHRNLDTRALRGSLAGEVAIDRQRRDAASDVKVLRTRTLRTSANLIEPWLFGLRLQGQASLFYEQSNDDRDFRFLHRRDSRGVELALVREFSRMFRSSLTGHFARVHQSYDIFLDTDDATRDSLAQVLPSYFDNAVGLALTRDTRDDRVTPNRGSMQTLIGEVAGGPLRGASSYQKLQFVSSWYTPRSNGSQWAFRFMGGVMSPVGSPSEAFSPGQVDEQVARVPKERRFFVGGVNSLRGFGENSITPDGGLAMLLANLEWRVPLRGPFGFEAFVDAGNVWARPTQIRIGNFVAPWDARRGRPGDLRYSYGVGARFMLPFGPLRMDLAWSQHPEFSSGKVFGRRQPFVYQFAIGPSF